MKNFYTFSNMYKNYQLLWRQQYIYIYIYIYIVIYMYEIKLSKLPCDFNSTRIILQKTSWNCMIKCYCENKTILYNFLWEVPQPLVFEHWITWKSLITENIWKKYVNMLKNWNENQRLKTKKLEYWYIPVENAKSHSLLIEKMKAISITTSVSRGWGSSG